MLERRAHGVPARTQEVGRSVIWIDLHVHKNGGTSIRDLMMQLEEAGQLRNVCTLGRCHIGHYNLTRTVELMGCSNSTAVELHEKRFVLKWFLERRAQLQHTHPCSKILLTTRVREPLSFYLSMFRWANIMRRFSNREQQSPNHSSILFHQWAPANLQSTMFAFGDFRCFAEGLLWSGKYRYSAFAQKDYAELAAMLQNDFDMVFPMDQFDDMLSLIQTQYFGGSEPQTRRVWNRTYHARPRWGTSSSNLDDTTVAREEARICPNMTRCREHIESIAPFDVRLWALARELASTLSLGRVKVRRMGDGEARALHKFTSR